jgi:hypothetical protein
MECCKSLQPLSVSPAKSLVAYNTDLFSLQWYAVASLISSDAAFVDVEVPQWDTGPPGVISFAESVLQRSILAHAPPVLA